MEVHKKRMLSEEEQLEQVRRSLGIEPKKLLTTIPQNSLNELIATLGFSLGLLTAVAMAIKESNKDLAEALLIEADNLKRKLSRELYLIS